MVARGLENGLKPFVPLAQLCSSYQSSAGGHAVHGNKKVFITGKSMGRINGDMFFFSLIMVSVTVSSATTVQALLTRAHCISLGVQFFLGRIV